MKDFIEKLAQAAVVVVALWRNNERTQKLTGTRNRAATHVHAHTHTRTKLFRSLWRCCGRKYDTTNEPIGGRGATVGNASGVAEKLLTCGV